LFGGEGPQQPNYHGSVRGGGSREEEDKGDESDRPETTATPLAQLGDLGAALEALPEEWIEAPLRSLV